MQKKELLNQRAKRLVELCSKSHFSKRPTGTQRTFLENYDISFDGRVDKVKIKRQKRGLTKIIFNSVWLGDQSNKEGIFNPSDTIDALLLAIKQADSA
jgi:hypothetical protein